MSGNTGETVKRGRGRPSKYAGEEERRVVMNQRLQLRRKALQERDPEGYKERIRRYNVQQAEKFRAARDLAQEAERVDAPEVQAAKEYVDRIRRAKNERFMARYHTDPTFKERYLEYVRAYDRAKSERRRQERENLRPSV